jgi:glutathione S-transferase
MKLYRLPHSPFARKTEMLIQLLRRPCTVVDLPYADRSELALLTGGYVQVPVLVDDDGTVVVDSRKISEHLLVGPAAAALVPPPFDGPIWAYADWCDGGLEDVAFRIFSPQVRAKFTNPGERALYNFIKERKFGPGCVDAWARDRTALLARAQALLAPSVRTLAVQPFLFGAHPTLADAALYGVLAATCAAEGELPGEYRPLAPFMQRLESATQ